MFAYLVVRWLDDGFSRFFMTIASKKLKRTLWTPWLAQAQASFSSSSELMEGLVSNGQLRNFPIKADEPESFGGKDSAPNPVAWHGPWEDDGEDDPNWNILGV